MRRRVFSLRNLRRWHARIGVVAMLFFLELVATGVVLNHGHGLDLDGRRVHVSWLVHWYGIRTEQPNRAFRSGNHELTWANGRWLFDGNAFAEKVPQPVGVVEFSDMVVIASDAALYLYGGNGDLIDRLGPGDLPGIPVQAIGSSVHKLVLRTDAGTFSSEDALSWEPALLKNVGWSIPVELSPAERRAYEQALTPGISVQRLLLDLHSGRIFGRYGPLIVDALALALAGLSLTGLWLFLITKRRRRSR